MLTGLIPQLLSGETLEGFSCPQGPAGGFLPSQGGMVCDGMVWVRQWLGQEKHVSLGWPAQSPARRVSCSV